MWRRGVHLAVGLVGMMLGASNVIPFTFNPFAFLAPDVVFEPAERTKLDGGGVVVHVLPGRDGHLSLTAAIRADVSPDRLLAWSAEVEQLQKGKYVQEIRRLSDPPRIEDLDALVFDDDDVQEMRQCRPGDCAVKLNDAEIADLQQSLGRPGWEAEVQRGLRRVILQRAEAYLASGDVSILPYHDDRNPVSPGMVFSSLIDRLTFVPRRFPCLTEYLRGYPFVPDAHVVDAFLYWSKETLGVKPIVSLTHVTMTRFADPQLPEAVVVAKQVYATHYKNGSITMTAITGSESARYLVYVHRSQVDVLQGMFGGLVRRMIERRVRAEAPGVLMGLRQRLESGDPPVEGR